MSTQRRTRIVDSSVAGWAPGRWQAQYWDREMDLWFDIGGPKDSRVEAQILIEEATP